MGKKTISNSFVVNTVDDPVGLVAQYCATATPNQSSQIHTSFQTGDLYMRTRTTEETFSGYVDPNHPWNRIVGESGGETNYKFGISAQETTASSTTAPTLKPNTTWSDFPVQVEANYPYLWSKVQKKDGNGNDVGVASYIRLTGEQGDSIFQVQAFKYFSGTPSSSDKPTKTTNIWQNTTDFGNGWHNRPTKQAGTGLSSVDYGEVAGWFANGVVTIPSPGDSGINIGTIYFTTSQADVDVEIEITSSSEASYDYGAIGKLDTTSLSGATASSIKSDNGTICSGKVSGNGTTMLVTLSVALAGRHSVQIAYAKDGSSSSFNDNAVVQVMTSVDSPNDLAYCCMATVVNGTVSGSWSSPIPWQGDKGDGAKYIYLRGAGNNNPMPALFTSFNGTTANNVQITSRGLTLLLVNRSDLSIYSQTSYDVYGDGESAGIPQCNALASAINNASSSYFVCIVSFDAVRWNDNLVNALKSCGSGGVEDQTPYRVPFAFIGYKGLGEGYAMQVQSGQGSTDAPAEITAYVANGALAATKSGQRGKVGRFYYYSGFDWDANNDTNTFVVNDAQVPYFSKAGSTGNKYYVFNPETIPASGSMTMAQMWSASNQSFNNKPWEAMTNDFKYLITEVIFAQFAQFGSAIINGDWMLSTNGTINGVAYNNGALYNGSPAYTWFDPQYPNESVNTAHSVNGKEWTGYNFVPNYAVDLLTGATYQQNAYVNGSVKTKSMGVEFADIRSMADDSMFVVGVDTTVGGTNISGIWNFKTKYQTIFLPTNRYSNYGQRIILYNSTVGLGGAAGTTIMCGEIDSQRLTTLSYLRGVGINYNSSKPYEPIPLNSYYRVESIEFLNGVVELMCVPTDTQGQLCEWVVVNIGTNIYRMTKYD